MEGDLATQETQQEPQDLRSVLESAIDKTEAPEAPETPAEARARDEAGRFAPNAAKPAETTTQPAEVKPEPLPEKRPPSSWKKDAAAEFDKLPAHVQDEILRRETDFHRGIEGFKTHADLGKSMERAIQPYLPTIQALGVTPDQAAARLFQADHILRNSAPDQKAAYFAQLAQEYGIDLGQAQAMPTKDPHTLNLERQLAQLQYQQQQFLQSQQEQQQESLNSEIQRLREKFGDDFDVLREDAAALLQAGRASDADDAFEKARYANPQTRQALLEQQRQEALKQAQSAAIATRAKAAAVSVRGSSPASGSASAPTSLRAALEAAFNG